ncbi:hypothetical protein GF402_08120, partial [Candidatus Fermentibacteria bacterium]|nr:hypothetical protein [Candidatus Fermentibacteria bacterium]
MSFYPPRFLVILSSIILISTVATAQTEWLEFNAGAPEHSSPLTRYNAAWDEFLSFDVELRGLLADTVEVDSIRYLRFDGTPGITTMDSVGYPELPAVVCYVMVPDSTDLSVSAIAACLEKTSTLPV